METQTARRAFCIESGIIDIETYLISSSSWIPCKCLKKEKKKNAFAVDEPIIKEYIEKKASEPLPIS
ncbi:hypothetical protein Glove_374g19 [Diversispora epigaea]|uniref:Uncharacterized protein n=1 Tax=Diversispora epigaea TaxID=1348612 RepID=A0A397H5E7_9GLOM|nr:hypothetical protein Glove_374g18 [Diversispora epigaea]RHZ58301.1 hypothetical protein Glove_374g19 [Diversispora epigaea]